MGHALIDGTMAESRLQEWLRKAAILHGYWGEQGLYYHTFSARFSQKGFPDTFLVRFALERPTQPQRTLIVELKSEHGAPTTEQLRWLRYFRHIPDFEVFIWRPHDRDLAMEILAGREAAPLDLQWPLYGAT